MIYQIYKTTNLLNDKIYVGQHSCSCKECYYMGSGRNFIKAISKYGKENFVKEILYTFDTFEEMNQKEAEIVNEDFVRRSDTYNLKTGGSFGLHSDETKRKISDSLVGKIVSEETKKKLSLSTSNMSLDQRNFISKIHKGKILSDETKRKISMSRMNPSEETRKKISNAHKGKTVNHSEETRRKISSSNIGKKSSAAHIEKYKSSMREKSKQKLDNSRILQIDVETGSIVNIFNYLDDIPFSSSNIKSGIIKGKVRYGFLWKLEKKVR